MRKGSLMLDGPVGGVQLKVMDPRPHFFGDSMHHRHSGMLQRLQAMIFGPVEATFHQIR